MFINKLTEVKNQNSSIIELGQASQITLGRGNAGHEAGGRPAFH